MQSMTFRISKQKDCLPNATYLLLKVVSQHYITSYEHDIQRTWTIYMAPTVINPSRTTHNQSLKLLEGDIKVH